MRTMIGIVLICLAVAREKEKTNEVIKPVTVYIDSVYVKEVHGKRLFYSWIGGADRYEVINSNPKISVSNYPQHPSVYLEGEILLPVHMQNTFTGWVKGSRIMRITINEDHILMEVPPDIPVQMTGRH